MPPRDWPGRSRCFIFVKEMSVPTPVYAVPACGFPPPFFLVDEPLACSGLGKIVVGVAEERFCCSDNSSCIRRNRITVLSSGTHTGGKHSIPYQGHPENVACELSS